MSSSPLDLSSSADTARVVLKLYIAGPTERSARAIVNIRKICEDHLPGMYDLTILDLLQNPSLASDDQIVAAPTLARTFPLPVRRFIGDFSQPTSLLTGLGIMSQKDGATS